MSDKRPGGGANGFQYVQPRRKIPKLDISIVASGSIATANAAAAATSHANGGGAPAVPQFVQPMMRSAGVRTNRTAVGIQRQQQPPPVRHHLPKDAPASEDMWGDEDEDFIMLASQVAENVENCGQNILVDSMDVSFGDFQRNRKPASCSTQAPFGGGRAGEDHGLRAIASNAAAAVNHNGRPKVGGPTGTEDFMSELPDFDGIDNVDRHIDDYLNNEQNTLARQFLPSNGSAGSLSGGGGTTLRPCPTTVGATTGTATNAYMQSVENAREVQLKFLQSQLAMRQTEAEQLQREVTKLNEQCQTKDGEVSVEELRACGVIICGDKNAIILQIAMIRYDLQMNKKQQTDLRQDKLNESERIKSEYAAKLVEMERINLGHQSEMEFMVGVPFCEYQMDGK